MSSPFTAFLPTLRTAARGALAVAFPRWCLGCGGLVETGPYAHLCPACALALEFIRPPHCSTCGWPFYGAVEGPRRCPHCIELDPSFREGRAGLVLRGPGRQFVHELKYRQGLHLNSDLATLVAEARSLVEFVRGAILVPVPLHPKRLRWRGFNQARLVADALVRAAGDGQVSELLDRVRDTPTQTRLDRAARERNMKDAFALRSGTVLDVAARYVVVDDVFTTGATLNACARVLHRAGAENVDVAALGHG